MRCTPIAEQSISERSEQAFVLVGIERMVNGGSNRKASAITENLYCTRFFKSMVSVLARGWKGSDCSAAMCIYCAKF